MSVTDVIVFIVVGLIAGFLASRLVFGKGRGWLFDIIIGIVGAFIGGWLAGLLHISINLGIPFLNQVIIAYHVRAHGEIQTNEEIAGVKAVPPDKLRPWPLGTGLAVRDWRFGRPDLPVGGFAEREPLYQAYERASGRSVDREHVLWWETLADLRRAAESLPPRTHDARA